MTCEKYEPLIALYVERDLDDTSCVQSHLTECAACRELLEDLKVSQTALKAWATEPIDPALLNAVRAGVLARTGAKRRLVWPLVAALAAGAAWLALWAPAPSKPAPSAQSPAKRVRVETVRALERPAAPIRRRKRKKAVKTEPLVVKMLTSDPDVVIIWLVDQKGD
jgi:hypothetical protein